MLAVVDDLAKCEIKQHKLMMMADSTFFFKDASNVRMWCRVLQTSAVGQGVDDECAGGREERERERMIHFRSPQLSQAHADGGLTALQKIFKL